MKRNLSIKALLLSSACLCASLPVSAQETGTDTVVETPAETEEEAEARQQTVIVRGRFIPNEKTHDIRSF